MMQPYSITVVAGARPNFMKIAPIVRALNARKRDAAAAGIDLRVSIVHTGQHYDETCPRSSSGILRSRSRTITRKWVRGRMRSRRPGS